jgi:hypothetical protein
VSASSQEAVAAGDWEAFLAQPALYIDVSRLADCFDGQLGVDLCARLKTSRRLKERLSALVCSRYGLARCAATEAVSDIDRSIALRPAEQLNELARRAGAIYWADSIANTILAADAAAVDSALGAALCAVALAHRDLSGPMRPLTPYDQLGSRVMEDGLRCVGAWCGTQPDGVGTRVRLKLAATLALDGPTEAPFDNLGPAIVRRAAD